MHIRITTSETPSPPWEKTYCGDANEPELSIRSRRRASSRQISLRSSFALQIRIAAGKKRAAHNPTMLEIKRKRSEFYVFFSCRESHEARKIDETAGNSFGFPDLTDLCGSREYTRKIWSVAG